HPARAVADPDYRDHAFDPWIDCRDEHDRRAAVARAVDAKALGVDLRMRGEEAQRRLDVGDAAVGREAGLRPVAVAPALVIEVDDDLTGLGEDGRVGGLMPGFR